MDGFIGWMLAVIIVAAVAGMTTKPILAQTRAVALGVGGVAIPLLLVFLGKPEMGFPMLGVALVGSAFVMPLVEWALGLSDTGEKQKGTLFQFSTGAEVNNPIPSSLILGMLVFAWPGQLLQAGWVAAPYLGFLLMMASLGGMFARVRESSNGVVAVHPKFLGQWFVAGLVATVLCAGVGYLLPLSLTVKNVVEQKLGGMIQEGPIATQRKQSKDKSPDPDYTKRTDQGLGDQKFQKDMPKPTSFRPEVPKPQDVKKKLIYLVILAAVAAAMLYAVKRWHRQITAFFKWLWALVSGPFVRAWKKAIEDRKRKKHEAAVRAVLSQIEDPYSDPPESLRSEDLGPLYEKMVADLSLLGARPKPDESVLAFVRRATQVYPVDKESLFYLGQVMTEGTFSPHPVSEPKLQAARERFLRVRKHIHDSVPTEQLPQKQAAYRWSYAESRLAEPAGSDSQ